MDPIVYVVLYLFFIGAVLYLTTNCLLLYNRIRKLREEQPIKQHVRLVLISYLALLVEVAVITLWDVANQGNQFPNWLTVPWSMLAILCGLQGFVGKSNDA